MAKHEEKVQNDLQLPDLEQSNSAVLNSLPSLSSRRSYDHAIRDFIDWYCSKPRLAFNRTVVTRYRIALQQRRHAPLGEINNLIIDLRGNIGGGIGALRVMSQLRPEGFR